MNCIDNGKLISSSIKQFKSTPQHTASRQARKPFCVGVREKRNLVTAIPVKDLTGRDKVVSVFLRKLIRSQNLYWES